MAIRKIQRQINGVASSTSVVVSPTGTNGIVLECKFEWKGKTFAPGFSHFAETSMWATIRDGNNDEPMGELETNSDLIIIPPFGGFQWFNPWGAVLKTMPDILQQMSTNTPPPYGAFKNGLTVSIFGETQVPNFPHDIEMDLTIMEFEV